MLNLDDDAINDWASSALQEVGCIPHPRTNNVLEHQAVSEMMTRLGMILNERATTEAGSLVASFRDPETMNELRRVLGDCGLQVTLRLIAWLTEELPGGVSVSTDLLDRRGDNPIGGLLAESERSALLMRLFAPDRLRDLGEATRDAAPVGEAA